MENKWNPKKRIKKVIIPYIIWTAIYVIVINHNNIYAIPKIFGIDLITGNASAAMYYILVYCQFTLLILLIDKIGRSKFKYLGFLIFPLEIIIMRLLPIIFKINVGEFMVAIKHISCLGWFTYFYLGYLVGNKIITFKKPNFVYIYTVAVVLQIIEGYIYYRLGEKLNCGTQLKLSAILTGSMLMPLVVNFIEDNKDYNSKVLLKLGNCSFGIYFIHCMVITVLSIISGYSHIIFPINAILIIVITYILLLIGRKILGKYSKYFAL